MHGRASLAFAAGPGGRPEVTRLVDLDQRAPLRVLFPRERGCGVPQAVLVTTSGGMAGGDLHEIAVSVGDGAAVIVTTQAAEKVYRSTGADTQLNVDLRAGDGSWLEWMPQETILFDGSRLHRRTTVDLAAGARFLGAEIVVFGRTARGEALTRGLLRDSWRIRVGGRLAWADTLLLDGDVSALLAARATFDGAVAAAALVYAGSDATSWLHLAQATLAGLETGGAEAELRLAVTCVNGLLLVRGTAREARRLRAALVEIWRVLRASTAGLPPLVPRIWSS